MRKEIAVNAPVTSRAPREDEEYRESEENRVDTHSAGEHKVKIHERAEEGGDAYDRADDKPDTYENFSYGNGV